METYDYEVAESGCLLFLLNHYVRSMITRRPSVAVLSKTTSTSSRVCSTTTSGVCSTTTSTTSWVCSTTTYTSVWSSFKTFPTYYQAKIFKAAEYSCPVKKELPGLLWRFVNGVFVPSLTYRYQDGT